jgi:hypothetical protein
MKGKTKTGRGNSRAAVTIAYAAFDFQVPKPVQKLGFTKSGKLALQVGDDTRLVTLAEATVWLRDTYRENWEDSFGFDPEGMDRWNEMLAEAVKGGAR